jgi:hypothetical protein
LLSRELRGEPRSPPHNTTQPYLVVNFIIALVGAAAVTSPFWVDAYVGPARAPERVNETWQVVGAGGLVWGVTAGALPLAPGASLTLAAGDGYFRADLSRLPQGRRGGLAVWGGSARAASGFTRSTISNRPTARSASGSGKTWFDTPPRRL